MTQSYLCRMTMGVETEIIGALKPNTAGYAEHRDDLIVRAMIAADRDPEEDQYFILDINEQGKPSMRGFYGGLIEELNERARREQLRAKATSNESRVDIQVPSLDEISEEDRKERRLPGLSVTVHNPPRALVDRLVNGRTKSELATELWRRFLQANGDPDVLSDLVKEYMPLIRAAPETRTVPSEPDSLLPCDICDEHFETGDVIVLSKQGPVHAGDCASHTEETPRC